MPITPEQFVAKFLEVQDGLIRDYFAGGIKAAALCHVMHHEIGLTHDTPANDAEETAEILRALGDDEATAEMLDLSQEHLTLHKFLMSVAHDAVQTETPIDALLALMFVIGRRMGLNEAAEMIDAHLAG
jgi:hypothetical protein